MTFTPTPLQDPSKNPAQDWGNVVVFMLLAFVLWWGFDTYVMKPQEEAMRVAAAQAGAAPLPATLPPQTREAVMARAARVPLANTEVSMTIDPTRARLDDVVLKNHFEDAARTQPITLLNPAGAMAATYTDTGWVSDMPGLKLPDDQSVWQTGTLKDGRAATFIWDNGAGLVFTRELALDDKFMVSVTDRVQNNTGASVRLAPYALLTQQGVPKGLTGGIVHEGAIGYVGDELVETSYGGWADLRGGVESYVAGTGWMGITSRYFMVSLAQQGAGAGDQIFRTVYTPPVAGDVHSVPRFQVDVRSPAVEIAPGAEAAVTTQIFAGAKVLGVLADYEESHKLVHFDLGVDFGWFYFLTKPFYYALTFLNHFVGNFGVAIILLTLALRLAVFPLANTSFKSFAKMKKVAPQVKELQQTYIKDKQKMQQELVKLYQKEKVNPLSGCLPILAQIPIFFAMYKVINVAIEMRHAPFFGWIQDLSVPDPTSVFNLFGLLPFDVPGFLNFGAWPLALFVLIMIQVRLSPPPPDPMMKAFFAYYYPVLIAFTMAHFAAGLVIYWATSSFLSLVQQIAIMRMQGVPIHLFGEREDAPAPQK